MIGSALQTAKRPKQREHKVVRYPAPINGIDNRLTLGSSDLNNCVYTYNLVPNEVGMRVREGYREWQIGITAGVGSGVHTLVPFDTINTSVANKLFAVTNEGIWDVTDLADTPVRVATFSNTTADAGYGTFARTVTTAEVDVLFYADNINGLWQYDAAGGVWAVPTGITGITVANVNFVTSHKGNIWFGVKNSSIGYYLPLLAITGAVKAQYFGDKFKQGGALKGLFSWTVDGGAGFDDNLVIVSDSGDVIVFQGSGPDEADWSMRGIYFIGDIPNTPRFGSEQGGELYLLSSYGVVSMNDLLQGVDTTALMSQVENSSMAAKVAGIIRNAMRYKITERGWGINTIPSQGGILINTPQIGSESYEQLYYNIGVRGWGIWRDVPMECFINFNDKVYFGTADGRVMIMDSTVDNALITPTTPPANGDDIGFSILTAFNPLGAEGTYKRVHLIRPDFLSTIAPSFAVQARFDYDIAEGVNSALDPAVVTTVALWDDGVWETAIWDSVEGSIYPSIGGAWGYGRYVAVATRGTCRANTSLIGWDIIYSDGGVMY